MEDINTYLPRAYIRNIPVVAQRLKEELGEESVLICPLRRGGTRDFDLYERYLKIIGCNDFPDHVRYDLGYQVGDELVDGEYTRFVDSVEKIQAKIEEEGKDVKHMIVFDNVSRTGTCILGGIVYGLEHRDELGIDKVYTMASYDLLGIINFSIFKAYEKWLGITEVMKNGWKPPNHPLFEDDFEVKPRPKIYRKLKKAGLLEHIGKINMERNNSVDMSLKGISDEDAHKFIKKAFQEFVNNLSLKSINGGRKR